jgi:hypothetical protein
MDLGILSAIIINLRIGLKACIGWAVRVPVTPQEMTLIS